MNFPVRKVVGHHYEIWKSLNAPYLRAGRKIIENNGGKKLKPTAQVIFRQAYTRLDKRDNVHDIVRDLESQIKLLTKV